MLSRPGLLVAGSFPDFFPLLDHLLETSTASFPTYDFAILNLKPLIKVGDESK